MSPHFDEVQADLRADPQIKWGFVVYRCTYGDDTAWARMMDRLNRQAQRSLESEGAGDLFSQIDWAVQENLEWDEAEPDLIKQRFIAWKNSNFATGWGGPRSYACIMINKESLDTLQDERTPPEDEFDARGFSWVWMISSSKGERMTRVGISFLMPRTWLMLDGIGWSAIWDHGAVVTP